MIRWRRSSSSCVWERSQPLLLMGGVLVFHPYLVLPEGDEQTVRNLRSVNDFLRLSCSLGRPLRSISILTGGTGMQGRVSKMWHLFLGVAPQCVRDSDYVRF